MTKLLRKDVLKWIRNLSDGSYRKTTGKLVNKKGNGFCCLGVWADQHGCYWTNQLVPIEPGKEKPNADQTAESLETDLLFGLSQCEQGALIELNDENKTWAKVIEYIKKEILPRTK